MEGGAGRSVATEDGCAQAGGGSAGLLWVLGALVGLARRRRRAA
jgi:MYXO-CTERM domain-containing protein